MSSARLVATTLPAPSSQRKRPERASTARPGSARKSAGPCCRRKAEVSDKIKAQQFVAQLSFGRKTAFDRGRPYWIPVRPVADRTAGLAGSAA